MHLPLRERCLKCYESAMLSRIKRVEREEGRGVLAVLGECMKREFNYWGVGGVDQGAQSFVEGVLHK